MNTKWITAKDDTRECFYVREEVFIKEQGFQNEFDEKDNIALHLCIMDKAKTVATARVFKGEDGIFYAGRICVLKRYRKNHIGATIMQEICNKVIELGGKKVSLSAQVNAKPFYEKQGFKSVGQEYLDEYCLHIDMFKNLK